MSYFSHYVELKIKTKAPHTHIEKDFIFSNPIAQNSHNNYSYYALNNSTFPYHSSI